VRQQHYLQLQLGQSTVLVDIDHVEVLLRKIFLFLTEESDRLFHPRFFAQLRGLFALLVEFDVFGRGGLEIANGGSCLHLASNSIGEEWDGGKPCLQPTLAVSNALATVAHSMHLA